MLFNVDVTVFLMALTSENLVLISKSFSFEKKKVCRCKVQRVYRTVHPHNLMLGQKPLHRECNVGPGIVMQNEPTPILLKTRTYSVTSLSKTCKNFCVKLPSDSLVRGTNSWWFLCYQRMRLTLHWFWIFENLNFFCLCEFGDCHSELCCLLLGSYW